MHPQALTLGLRLPMTRFIRNVSDFLQGHPSQLSAGTWRTVLGFEALFDLYSLEACQREVFSVVYSVKKSI